MSYLYTLEDLGYHGTDSRKHRVLNAANEGAYVADVIEYPSDEIWEITNPPSMRWRWNNTFGSKEELLRALEYRLKYPDAILD